MLINLYYQLLFMSVIAGMLYLVLKLFSSVTHKYFSAAWHYYSYLLVSSFFLIPYHSLLSTLNIFTRKTAEWSLSPIIELVPSAEFISTIGTIQLPEKSYEAYSYIALLPYLLMTGTLVFIAIVIGKNIQISQRIVKACKTMDDKAILDVLSMCKRSMGIKKEIPVYTCNYASTPLIIGLFRPRIVLPTIEFSSEELRYIFKHELSHWKNHDAWIQLILLFINGVHWFNPFAFMIRRDIDGFCEVLCDQRVTGSMNKEERRRYCELILSVLWHVADQRTKLYSAFSEKRNIERRVKFIMKNQSKKWVRMFAIVMTFALALTGAGLAAYAADYDRSVDSVAPISQNVNFNADAGRLVSEADGLTPAQAEILPSSEDYSISSDFEPMATVYWPDTVINYNTEMGFISSATDGYFIIRQGITATFEFAIESGSENIRVAFKDKNGNETVLFEGSTSGQSISYTPSSDVEGNFYVWNKAVSAITLTDLSLSY